MTIRALGEIDLKFLHQETCSFFCIKFIQSSYLSTEKNINLHMLDCLSGHYNWSCGCCCGKKPFFF